MADHANGIGEWAAAVMPAIDFWFSIGSTYTCLTVMRLADQEAKSGVRFNWRPFNVRAIMIEQKNIPFSGKPVKMSYMWRDIERRAVRYGLSISVPAPYPLDQLVFANQVAELGRREGWCENYVRETYRLWFQEGMPAGSEPNLSRSLEAIGQEPSRVIEQAGTQEIIEALDIVTDEARQLGVFGAPTFVVDGEVFWGDDRLDDAIAWCRDRR